MEALNTPVREARRISCRSGMRLLEAFSAATVAIPTLWLALRGHLIASGSLRSARTGRYRCGRRLRAGTTSPTAIHIKASALSRGHPMGSALLQRTGTGAFASGRQRDEDCTFRMKLQPEVCTIAFGMESRAKLGWHALYQRRFYRGEPELGHPFSFLPVV